MHDHPGIHATGVGTGANASRKVGAIVKPPWRTWKGSRVGRYIRFIETYLTAPVVRTKFKVHQYQRDLYESWLDPTNRAEMDILARGNAKSTSAAGFIIAHSFMEDDAQVPVIATTLTQARLTSYGQVINMLNMSDTLGPLTKIYSGMGTERILVPSTNALIIPLADKPSSLQGLNPSVGLLDEASEASLETWSALTLAAGKRSDSLALGISTPSFLPENAALAVERAYLAGKAPGLRFNVHRAPIGCDHRDEANWYVANPAMSTKPVILHIDALRMAVGMEREQYFRCYRLAQWPEEAEGGWLGPEGYERWKALTQPYSFTKAPTWVGVDMARTHDCAAVVAGQFRPDGRFHTKARIWTPQADQPIDPIEVIDHIRQLHRDYGITEVGYDPAYFDLAAAILRNEGINAIEFPQNPVRMAPAVGQCYDAIHRGELTHDEDETFTQHVMNAVPHPHEQGFTLRKTKQRFKIDAAVALCMCHRIATDREPELPDSAFTIHW